MTEEIATTSTLRTGKKMNIEQYQNWKDFAIRFAKHHYSKRQNPSLDEVLCDIETFFDENKPEEINDWEDICDYVSELFDNVYSCTQDYASDRQRRLLEAYWHRDEDRYEDLKLKIVDQYESPLHCSLRIGLDFISGQIGVLGFTAADIQGIYPEGLPSWIDGEAYVFKDGQEIRLSEMPPGTLLAF